jgi:Oxygen-sensitive ribonucleoside-triphosphate reductase
MGHPIKVCSNCGEILLALAKKCPKCGHKGDFLLEADSDDSEKIQQIRDDSKYIAPRRAEPPVPRCPKCGSTSITVMKKGFGVGKAAAGALLLGPIGIAAGGLGANKVQRVCVNCGHKF